MIKVPADIITEFGEANSRTPTLYAHPKTILRTLFWERLVQIERLILANVGREERARCLDFGGGGGMFLPALSRLFESVTLVDLAPDQARYIMDRYKLENVNIVEQDIVSSSPPEEKWNVVVAADVLEHFRSLREPIAYIRSCLKDGGYLFTSLPRENWIYEFGRWIFGVQKPEDHYHRAKDVERVLATSGFKKARSAIGLLYFLIWPFFSISAWRKV